MSCKLISIFLNVDRSISFAVSLIDFSGFAFYNALNFGIWVINTYKMFRSEGKHQDNAWKDWVVCTFPLAKIWCNLVYEAINSILTENECPDMIVHHMHECFDKSDSCFLLWLPFIVLSGNIHACCNVYSLLQASKHSFLIVPIWLRFINLCSILINDVDMHIAYTSQAFEQAGKSPDHIFRKSCDIDIEKVKQSKYFRALFQQSCQSPKEGLVCFT